MEQLLATHCWQRTVGNALWLRIVATHCWQLWPLLGATVGNATSTPTACTIPVRQDQSPWADSGLAHRGAEGIDIGPLSYVIARLFRTACPESDTVVRLPSNSRDLAPG
ncbi:hypothetical protein BKA91DRAFT_31361 [Yarrowia lipolytica]|nr:hypothetical protein BKA91DRAFT_31361 [Yarrowia lipolytica]KAE8171351.1 hypothetical protein BKA90DRAFT_28986 [Yarrowia lipolytica]RMJ00991.1 hypothetical protein BD777DRAFT_2828 [Yarrowia lipolytica]